MIQILNRRSKNNPALIGEPGVGKTAIVNALAIDEPLEYARLYLDGNLQMWVDAEDSLEL
mgnify:CR=1 FL=1